MIESDEEIRKRIISLSDGKDYGICSSATAAQVAMNELDRFFLGENFYYENSITNAQCNSDEIYVLETRYKKSLIRLLTVSKVIESDEEIRKRIISLSDGIDRGLFSVATDAQVAFDELTRFFLGDDFYIGISQSSEQCNTECLYFIETKYKKSLIRRKLVKRMGWAK